MKSVQSHVLVEFGSIELLSLLRCMLWFWHASHLRLLAKLWSYLGFFVLLIVCECVFYCIIMTFNITVSVGHFLLLRLSMMMVQSTGMIVCVVFNYATGAQVGNLKK